jgi:hypothetical protein
MNNKQQTAVDWIEQEMLKGNLSLKEILEQAKEMEKEQHENTWDDSFLFKDDWEMKFEQYYKETYGGDK